MRTEQVTKVWEFYRDNCAGYKEPMRKQLRELDSYVDHLESLADDGEKAAEENEKLRLEVEQLEEERDEHFRRYDELEEENARLRETMGEITEMSIMSSRPLKHALEESRAENAKLRELVRDMHADVVRLKDELTTFDHKPTQEECVVGMLVLGILGSINDRMRELGVEVQS